jgi:hypothetical protein
VRSEVEVIGHQGVVVVSESDVQLFQVGIRFENLFEVVT